MKYYYAFSTEHMGAFWKNGCCGYTFFEEKAHKFTEAEILEKQKTDPYSGWKILTRDNFLSIELSGEKEWAVPIDNEGLLGYVMKWGVDNIKGWMNLRRFEQMNQ